MSPYSHIQNEALQKLCSEVGLNNEIDSNDYSRFGVKKGLRNADGTGVMAGLTKVCSVEGYFIMDGERVPKNGKLIYRGIDVNDIVEGFLSENRFGFEEVAWLLIFGRLPTISQLERFKNVLAQCRELPDDFIEDMIMKAPSSSVMNKLSRCVLALYSYDDNPDDISPENVLRQCIQLLAQLPSIMNYAYQVKRRHFYKKSMYLHNSKPDLGTAENILRTLRPDKSFTDEEAKLLDLCMVLQADHGGGNNSTFATRVLTSTGTDTYSAISAGIGALKGPRHGGANLKVREMTDLMSESISDVTDERQVADYLKKLIRKEAGDKSGLVYGMGHAVYTLSDPRAILLKRAAEKFCKTEEQYRALTQLKLIEKLTPEVFKEVKGSAKVMCANVDLYSGFIYSLLGIPTDLFTPIFTISRLAGWSAHRLEELATGSKIIRPAYKSVTQPNKYVSISERSGIDDPLG